MGCASSTEVQTSHGNAGMSRQPQQAPYPQSGHNVNTSAYPQQQPLQQQHQGQQQQQAQQQHAQQQAQQQPAADIGYSNFTHRYDVEQTEIAVRSITPTKELLQQYIDIDNQVRALESKNVLKRFTELQTANQSITGIIQNLEKSYEEAKKKTEKEKGDYDDLFSAWNTASGEEESSDPQIMKEKREWIEAKGEEEVVKAELDGVRDKLIKNEASLKAESVNMEELKQKYKEQEEHLAAIFKGQYGSDHENKLEAESDFLDERKQRVGAARYKWTNGRNLLNHATSQLCQACKKWMQLNTMNPQDRQATYLVATEARNNIIAASQNIISAKRYLNTIEFPYCKPSEVKVLESAAAHVYTDMLSAQRHQYVYANVYHSMYKRCKALVNWFTHVLTDTIAKDLASAAEAANSKAQELRQERLNLISIKIKEELKQDVKFEAHATEIEEDSESIAEDQSQVFEAQGGAGEDTTEGEPPVADVEPDEPFSPVPLNELVQAPNKEDLFGDAQELYKKHQENLEELEKNQMINKVRQEQGLEEKLRARRSRRQRQEAVAAEEQLQQA